MADDWRTSFLRLAPGTGLRRLEEPCLYQAQRDELYALDEAALAFLARCDGSSRGASLTDDDDFVAYCLAEGLLETHSRADPVPLDVATAPTPSLRYLELQLTHRCNLRCRHCYLGSPPPTELPLADAVAVCREFAAMGGLRLLLSGGEPLLYPHLEELLDATAGLGICRVLLSNGTLLDRDSVRRFPVEQIQVSLDGWRQGHELLRGPGTFDRAVAGIRAAREAGVPVSLATMVHRGNLGEFGRLARFAAEIGAVEWGVDLPALSGNLREHPELCVPFAAAALCLPYGYGGGRHGAQEGYACGSHLLTVLPDGTAVKCGFYADAPLGDARAGLAGCWGRLRPLPVAELDCRDCPAVADCAGGCRYRAVHPLGADEAMCALHGVSPPRRRP